MMFLCLLPSVLLLFSSRVTAQNCQEIGTLERCGYNYTGHNMQVYPNPVTTNIADAARYLQPLQSLKDSGCSPHLQSFICSALLPECNTWRGPCKSLCDVVTGDCAAWIIQNDQRLIVLQLTSTLFNCSRYRNDNCISPVNIPRPTPTPSPSPSPSPTVSPTRLPNSLNATGCPPSSLTYYTDTAKSFAIGWIATWSVFCFFSTLLTILTFAIKPSRFEYPWRPIIYLAISFNIHSIGYFFALILGRNIVTCPKNVYVNSTASWGWGHAPCLIVYGLLYYSTMTAFLWWLTLTLSWFLASVFKWSNEAIGRLAPFFHVISWILPLLMVISLVAGQVISADELTGTCFVVRDDQTPSFYALLIGVILPLMLFLFIGIVFLSVGLISVCRIREFLRHKGREKETMVLEKLMLRIGIFVSVYVLPATVVIGCFFYELDQRPKWSTIEESQNCSGNCKTANPSITMVRVFMFLLIGSLTGVWIWSRKTLESWRSLGNRFQECCVGIGSPKHQSGSSSISTANS